MRFTTFVGYATGGLDLAVKDAYQQLENWEIAASQIATVTIEGAPVTTATIRGADVQSDAEYWFTLTITYREV